jgi:hypothetical protein
MFADELVYKTVSLRANAQMQATPAHAERSLLNYRK